MTVMPGLYEISFGFYSRRKPVVQLLVNGEVVVTAVNSSSSSGVQHAGGGGGQGMPKSPQSSMGGYGGHSAGNVTGLTFFDVLSLPPKVCRIGQVHAKMAGGHDGLAVRLPYTGAIRSRVILTVILGVNAWLKPDK